MCNLWTELFCKICSKKLYYNAIFTTIYRLETCIDGVVCSRVRRLTDK